MRVLLHFDCDETVLGSADLTGLDVVTCPEHDDERFARLLPEAEVIWHVLRPLTAADIAAAPRLRLVQKLGSGVNTIAVAAAEARGVAVANMPGTNAPAVAEAALLLMLAVLRKAVRADALTRSGHGWPVDTTLTGGELGGRTVGLVGDGEIARRLTGMLTAVGADVVYTSRTPHPDDPRWRELDELLAGSDVVSLHLPLTEETHHLLDRRRLGLLRTGAVLVNTARGAVVDESALVDALREGRLGGAGLDVFEEEPVGPGHPLFDLDNVVVMPHVAWLTRETLRRCLTVAAENCRRLAAGEGLVHRVA